MSPLEWMAWTTPTALFFVAVILMLIGTTVLGLRSPSVARKGYILPMPTTRGDRLYVGLIGCAFIMLAWLGLRDESSLIAVGICVVWLALILRWG